jgi:hypothetical protein
MPRMHRDAELHNDSLSLLIPEHKIRGKPLMCSIWPRTVEGNRSEQKLGEAAKYCVRPMEMNYEALCFLGAAMRGHTVFGSDSSTVPAARRATS